MAGALSLAGAPVVIAGDLNMARKKSSPEFEKHKGRMRGDAPPKPPKPKPGPKKKG